jgi:hypothetical protein
LENPNASTSMTTLTATPGRSMSGSSALTT